MTQSVVILQFWRTVTSLKGPPSRSGEIYRNANTPMSFPSIKATFVKNVVATGSVELQTNKQMPSHIYTSLDYCRCIICNRLELKLLLDGVCVCVWEGFEERGRELN